MKTTTANAKRNRPLPIGEETSMNDAAISTFRNIAEAMQGPEPRTWEWIGEHISQRMFGVTRERAERYAAQYGGTAREMPPTESLRPEKCARHNVRYCRETGCF